MNDKAPVTLPVDAWNDPEFVEEVVKGTASFHLSAYMASEEAHDAFAAKIRPYMKEILYALEAKLRHDQRGTDEQG